MTQLERLQKLVRFWTKQNAERKRAAEASEKEFRYWSAKLAAAEAVAKEAMINFNDDHSTLAGLDDEQIKSNEEVFG